MELTTWIAFVVASLILTVTPGPSILLGVVHSLKYGVKPTIATALGDISANFIQMIIVAVGLGAIVAASESAFLIIKWFGVVVLAYMGLKMLFSSTKLEQANSTEAIPSARSRYLSGFMVAAGNPKAIIFFTALFPQFIDPAKPLLMQMAIMCPTMALMDFTLVILYAMGARRFLGFIQRKPRMLNQTGGTALILASGYLSTTNR